MKLDIDGTGEVELEATMYPLVVYENAFGTDPIKDVFGKHQVQQGDQTVLTIDYTQENWTKEIQLLWAMVKTAADLKEERGDLAPNDRVPGGRSGFEAWTTRYGKVNMHAIANAVIEEAVQGFFRS